MHVRLRTDYETLSRDPVDTTGIDKECKEFNFFARLETHLTIGFS